MSDLLIGLDLDGVCYKWDETARYMLRQRIMAKGANPPAELFFPSQTYNSIQEIVSPGDWKWLWTGAISEGLYRYGHVVNGAIEGVRELNLLGDVVVITHRPQAAVHDTLAWLTFMFDKAPLTGVVIQSNGQGKSAVTPTPDIYIDDMPHVANDILLNTASQMVLFDQPWNQGFEPSARLVRAKGWRDVVTAVEYARKGHR